MNWTEWNKWARLGITIIATVAILDACFTRIEERFDRTLARLESKVSAYQTEKGIAIADYLDTYHSISVPPEQAKHFSLNANNWNISIDDLQIFGSWDNGKKENGGRW